MDIIKKLFLAVVYFSIFSAGTLVAQSTQTNHLILPQKPAH